MISTWAWIIWLVGIIAVISTTRNPLYLIIVLLCLAIIYNAILSKSSFSEDTETNFRFPFSPIRIGIMVVILSALFNAAISHFGETILFSVPSWIPMLGPKITLEAFTFGVINGLILFGILWAFMIFNHALPTRKIIQLIPRSFYPIAVVTSIAISFIPSTLRNFNQIREAQAIRGHQLRGVKDWIPLILPLFIGGLEQAIALAEAMTARGFANREDNRNYIWLKQGVLAGVIFLILGWLLRLFSQGYLVGNLFLLIGIITVLISLWVAGKQFKRSTYKRDKITISDLIIIIPVALIMLLLFVPAAEIPTSSLSFEIYPEITWPDFNVIIGTALLGFMIPAIILNKKKAPKKMHLTS